MHMSLMCVRVCVCVYVYVCVCSAMRSAQKSINNWDLSQEICKIWAIAGFANSHTKDCTCG